MKTFFTVEVAGVTEKEALEIMKQFKSSAETINSSVSVDYGKELKFSQTNKSLEEVMSDF